jgi:hypothetical protein
MPELLQIEMRPIDGLIPDPANARVHNEENIAAIKGSLARFGQQKPIVITSDSVIVAGNGTLEAAKALGWTELQCVVTTLKDVQAVALAIADNRTAEVAAWDLPALTKTLRALGEEGFPLDDIGWLPHQVEPLMGATWRPDPDAGEHEPMENAGGNSDEDAPASWVGDSLRSVLFTDEEYNALLEAVGTPSDEDGRSISQRILDKLEVSV